MTKQEDRILIVDDDPDVLDLLAYDTLEPSGYSVRTVDNGPAALNNIMEFKPDVIIAAIDMIGFTGKDLLAAMRSQGLVTPVIMMAPEGQQNAIIDAFRLGARDYLSKPLREAVVISAVDRVMAGARVERERQELEARLKQANVQLEQRVKELTTLLAIGKTIVNLTSVETLYTRLVEAATHVTGSKAGWLLIKDDSSGQLILRAARNVPPQINVHLNKPWNSGMGPIVMMSGEPLRVAGDGLRRFPIGKIVKSALIVPIMVRDTSVGILAVVRPTPEEFTKHHEAMITAVADYASIALINIRLIRELTAKAKQQS